MDTHSPTVTVNAGFRDEARTMSGLSPVARMERPMRVFRNASSSTPARTVTEAASSNSYQSPPMPLSRRRVKIVLPPSRLWLAFQPIAIRLTVYRPVLVTMPARMEGIPKRVCKKAVTNPAQLPASMAAGMARIGCPPAASVTETAAPRTKQPSVVISAMFKIRKLRNRAMATKAYKKPSSRAVCVIISKRMRSFHAAAPGSRPGERGGEFDWISPWWC